MWTMSRTGSPSTPDFITPSRRATKEQAMRRRFATPAAGRRVGDGGFTMIEIMVVIGIVVMLLGLSAPIFMLLARGAGLDGARENIKSGFRRFRQQAITSGRPVFVVVEHWRERPVFQAWMINPRPNGTIRTIKDPEPIALPDQVVFDEDWVADLRTFEPPGTTELYSAEVRYLGASTEEGSPNYEFQAQRGPMRKPLIFIFRPEGSVRMLGRDDISTWQLERISITRRSDLKRDQMGDMMLTIRDDASEESDIVYFDVNQATGLVSWVKPLDD
jgi:prepilin-type N-terminal cleavage/methylation domain-containing protein